MLLTKYLMLVNALSSIKLRHCRLFSTDEIVKERANKRSVEHFTAVEDYSSTEKKIKNRQLKYK